MSFDLKLNKERFLLFFWGLTLFFITRQVPFNSLSVLGNLGTLMVCVLGFNRQLLLFRRNYIPILGWILFLVVYAIFAGNSVGNIFRFSIILLFLMLAYFLELPLRALRLLFIFTFIQCLFLWCLELVLMLFFDLGSYGVIRHFFLGNNWGDIYSYDGMFYRMPIKGNALLPFCYILSYYVPLFPQKGLGIYRIIYLGACVFAGNFAYLISIFFFHIIHYFTSNKSYIQLRNKILLSVFLAIGLFPLVYSYTAKMLDMKRDVSLGTRYDQAEVLMNNLSESATTFVLGQGLGNLVDVVTPFRDYSDMVYYELQALYFFNQMGVLNFVLFILVNIYLAFKTIRCPQLLFVYLCYVVYAVTNPYILDTIHFVVIVSLVISSKIYENRKYRNVVLP